MQLKKEQDLTALSRCIERRYEQATLGKRWFVYFLGNDKWGSALWEIPPSAQTISKYVQEGQPRTAGSRIQNSSEGITRTSKILKKHQPTQNNTQRHTIARAFFEAYQNNSLGAHKVLQTQFSHKKKKIASILSGTLGLVTV